MENPKLIIALDFCKQNEALDLIDKVDPSQCALKIGSEMFTLFGMDFVRGLIQRRFKIFLDLKFHDIPNTVAQACRACAELGVWMINVHAMGGLQMMQSAKEAVSHYTSNRPLLIAVTVLTSMSSSELPTIGLEPSVDKQVERLAKLAYQAELDGVVCSAFEVPTVKEVCGSSFLTVTPGIRLSENEKDDQVRIMTPEQATELGSDFLVIGRPITRASNPSQVIDKILSSINN
ncbi:orotidine-5'-phosphate decarboxylase [Legionella brunensis]|uniref:Orotidine 5'-phosphate decarboxylase n=1 Tax=Legionella brunensis TaxID=29422 RepID=A0A0W0S5D9_9GAMM|nr:orotidine-5'-phosphate decarboxylase [Legionella brunensis]KTC78321.1 orotidine 5`-phosphate decarboxylase [Legionella brunensis]